MSRKLQKSIKFFSSVFLKGIERENVAPPAVSAIEGPVEVATIAFVHKNALHKYVDHVLVASNVDLLKCRYVTIAFK